MSAHQIRIDDLTITPIDPASPIPLYYQVEADLRALLASQRIAPGDLLPTEHEFAEAYRVGRHTIRTALSRLVTDQLILRKAGHGTIVRERHDPRKFSLTQSFTEQMAQMGLRAGSMVLHREVHTINGNDPRALHDRIGSPCLVLNRLRMGNDEPIALQRTFVVLERCPNLEQRDFTNHSLYQILSDEYHLVITEISHTVSAITADKRQAERLQIAPRAALLVVNTSAFLENREVIESSVTYYRADKYEYTITQTSL